MIGRLLTAVMLALSAVLAGTAMADVGVVATSEQDGVLAWIVVRQTDAEAHWRLRTPPSDRKTEVSASFNGRPVPDAAEAAESAPTRLILLVLDLTDSRREAQILRDKYALLKIAGQGDDRHEIAVATYDKELDLLWPNDGKVETLLDTIARAKPQSVPVDLERMLLRAMDLAARAPVGRRAIDVLTDGHSDRPVSPELLISRACAAGISLSFILTPSERSSDVTTLARLAAETGGTLAGTDAEREAFLTKPFELLDAEGDVRFSLESARRYFWESNSALDVTFRYDGGQIELASQADVAPASPTETAIYVWQNYPLEVGASAAVLVALLAGALFFIPWAARKRKAPSVPEGAPARRSRPPRTYGEGIGSAGPQVLSCEDMWKLLQQSLRRRGVLPPDAERLTPAEIVRAASDEQANTFVFDYYYPQIYGRQAGRLSDAEALKLVRALAA